jgi:hypothetical protein
MVNLDNDCDYLIFRCAQCLFLSLMRNHIMSASNNKKQITMLRTCVAVGIHIDVIAADNIDDKEDDDS